MEEKGFITNGRWTYAALRRAVEEYQKTKKKSQIICSSNPA
jgi:hypothetical protein